MSQLLERLYLIAITSRESDAYIIRNKEDLKIFLNIIGKFRLPSAGPLLSSIARLFMEYCIKQYYAEQNLSVGIVHRDIYEFVITPDATTARGVRLKLTRFHNEIPI